MFVNTICYLLILCKLVTIESSIPGEDCPTKPMVHLFELFMLYFDFTLHTRLEISNL